MVSLPVILLWPPCPSYFLQPFKPSPKMAMVNKMLSLFMFFFAMLIKKQLFSSSCVCLFG